MYFFNRKNFRIRFHFFLQTRKNKIYLLMLIKQSFGGIFLNDNDLNVNDSILNALI